MFDEVRPKGAVTSGLLLGLALNFGALIASVLLLMIGIGVIGLAAMGVVQLCWMIPMIQARRKRGEVEAAQGLMIAAGITFLLNATCDGMMLGDLRHMH